MFLRNKKTGEVIEWDKNLTYKLDREYTSLKELCENYEDCEAPKSEMWEPNWGDKYYGITEHGYIGKNCWGNNVLDAGAIDIGNVFRTEEDVEKARTWLKARKVLYDDTRGFKPDWGNPNEDKWGVYRGFWNGQLDIGRYTEVIRSPGPYFATREDAKASIRAHEKEWKIYLLGSDFNE